MKQITMKTPSGRLLVCNAPDEYPNEVEISESQFDLAFSGMALPRISVGSHINSDETDEFNAYRKVDA